MPPLKIGDKVRIICKTPSHGWGRASYGDIGVIREIRDYTNNPCIGRVVLTVDLHKRYCHYWATFADELELFIDNSLELNEVRAKHALEVCIDRVEGRKKAYARGK
jgi:hypothetical protein